MNEWISTKAILPNDNELVEAWITDTKNRYSIEEGVYTVRFFDNDWCICGSIWVIGSEYVLYWRKRSEEPYKTIGGDSDL
jgi:hypothetical protein